MNEMLTLSRIVNYRCRHHLKHPIDFLPRHGDYSIARLLPVVSPVQTPSYGVGFVRFGMKRAHKYDEVAIKMIAGIIQDYRRQNN
ncbi:hypothetical protein RRG08_028773 [Elysia crispata]|uniref:Uncharacterized protein n=1 Tax=Elysia crispata TaxID=231223 RepID=A0AAE0ZMB9_9GAST|nr:hypothetical protein RRG08_028773 [Elysia crispata]